LSKLQIRTPTLFIFLIILLLTACDSATSQQPTPTANPTLAAVAQQEVGIPDPVGVSLSATQYGQGKTWVICSHMNNSNRSIWRGLALQLAAQGYTVLAYDFPSFGQSGGS
jgi:pimeloyl-ACP methyl ester carboxylesterase